MPSEPLDVKMWLSEDELEQASNCTGSYTGRVVASFAFKLAAANAKIAELDRVCLYCTQENNKAAGVIAEQAAKIAELEKQYDYTNRRYKEDVEAMQSLLNKRQTDEAP